MIVKCVNCWSEVKERDNDLYYCVVCGLIPPIETITELKLKGITFLRNIEIHINAIGNILAVIDHTTNNEYTHDIAGICNHAVEITELLRESIPMYFDIPIQQIERLIHEVK